MAKVDYYVMNPPAITANTNAFTLRLILSLDPQFKSEREGTESVDYNTHGVRHVAHYPKDWDDMKFPDGHPLSESDLSLPIPIRYALRRMAQHPSFKSIGCDWDQNEPIRILIISRDDVRHPDRFLQALAHKINRLIKEAETTK